VEMIVSILNASSFGILSL